MDEVDAPDVIGIKWPQSDHGAVLMIKPFPPFMTMWELQSLFAPEPFHLLVIDLPAFDTQKLCDLAIAITAILFGKAYQA